MGFCLERRNIFTGKVLMMVSRGSEEESFIKHGCEFGKKFVTINVLHDMGQDDGDKSECHAKDVMSKKEDKRK